MLVQLWRKRNIPPFLVGFKTAITTLEISLAVPQKIPYTLLPPSAPQPAHSCFLGSDIPLYWGIELHKIKGLSSH